MNSSYLRKMVDLRSLCSGDVFYYDNLLCMRVKIGLEYKTICLPDGKSAFVGLNERVELVSKITMKEEENEPSRT